MDQIKTKLRKWGNSFGVVIPREVVNNKGLKEDSDVSITIERGDFMTVKDLMNLSKKIGLAKKLKGIDTQKILDEIDKDLEPEEE